MYNKEQSRLRGCIHCLARHFSRFRHDRASRLGVVRLHEFGNNRTRRLHAIFCLVFNKQLPKNTGGWWVQLFKTLAEGELTYSELLPPLPKF